MMALNAASPLSLRTGAHLAILALLLGFGAGTTRATEVDDFEVSVAKWRPEKMELRIEGYAQTPDSLVLVRDADTDALIGCAAVRADGKWMLKLRKPQIVPARMEVECDGETRQCLVAGVDRRP